jgi:hypothetical protein
LNRAVKNEVQDQKYTVVCDTHEVCDTHNKPSWQV